MWLTVLILGIKLQMSVCYWVFFTAWTMIMPLWTIVKYIFIKNFVDKLYK